MSSFDGGNEEDLHIGVDVDPQKGTVGFGKLSDAVRDFVGGISGASEATARVASEASRTINEASRAATQSAADMRVRSQAEAEAAAAAWSGSARNVEELRSRFARSAKADTDDAIADLQRLKRELETIRHDAASGAISPQERVDAVRATQAQVAQRARPDDAERFAAGDRDAAARYRAQVEAQRELQRAEDDLARTVRQAETEMAAARREAAAAEREASKTLIESVNEQIEAQRNATRLNKQSLEEEAVAYDGLLKKYSEYADARERIDRAITQNEIRQVAERRKSSSEGSRTASGSLINFGYLLPGEFGNAASNLGYFAQEGPAGLAIGAAAVGGLAVGGGIAAAADVAGKDEEALKRLSVAIKNQGGDWTSLSSQVDQWAMLQERTTVFGRDQTIPALTELANAGVRLADAQTIVRVAEDAAAATGKPLVEVTHGLEEAYLGNARSLVSLGVVTKDQVRDGMAFGDVLKAVERNMAGQATTTDTFADKQRQLKNAVEELERSFGEKLLPSLTDAATGVTKFVQSIDKKQISDATADVLSFANALKTVFDIAQSASKALDDLNHDFSELGHDVHTVLSGGFIGAAKALLPVFGDNGEQPRAHGQGAADSVRRQYVTVGYQQTGVTDVDSAIAQSSRKYGIDPALLRAVGEQETGLGTSSAYDPVTGRSKTPGNAGRGIFQLDPASGASQALLDRVSTDVFAAADAAAEKLRDNLRTSGGNVALALAAYNAGGPTVQGLAYAQQVEARISPRQAGPSLDAANALGLNPVGNLDIAGAGTIGRGGSADLQRLYLQFEQEQKAGISGARQEYESALEAITSDTSKSLQERAAAERTYNALVRADASEEAKAVREATKEREAAMRATESQADTERKRAGDTQIAYAREIEQLTQLRDKRAASGDADSGRDVDALNAKIANLERASSAAWTKALADARRYYGQTDEALDTYLAKLATLERGATPAQKTQLEIARAAGIKSEATLDVSSDDRDERIYRDAHPEDRAGLESLLFRDRAGLKSTPNRGLSGVSDVLDPAVSGRSSTLQGLYGKDAADAVKALDEKYRELFTDIADGQGIASRQDAAKLGALRNEGIELESLRQHYLSLGTDGADAAKSIHDQIVQLGITEHDTFDQLARDERNELKQRAEAYAQFADTATSNLARIALSGQKFSTDIHDVVKATVADMEQQFVKSGFAVLFGGVGGGDLNLGNALQRSLFGGVNPNQNAAETTEFHRAGKKAFDRIASAPTGGANDPLTVAIAGGAAAGGVAAAGLDLSGAVTGAQQYGLIGAIAGSIGAASIVGSIPVTTSAGGAAGGLGGLAASLGGGALSPIVGSDAAGSQAWDAAVGAGGSSSFLGSLEAAFGPGGGGITSLLKGGLKSTVGSVLSGIGDGTTVNSLLGGNQTFGTIGSALGAGVGTAFGGPVGGAIGGTLGGAIGGLFGPHYGPPSNSPDRNDPNYGQFSADWRGSQNGANGTTYYASAAYNPAFGGKSESQQLEAWAANLSQASQKATLAALPASVQAAVAQIQKLDAGNPTANLDFTSLHDGVWQLANGQSLSYTDAQKLVAAMTAGNSLTGSTGSPNTYTIKRSYPDYNAALATAGLLPADPLGYGAGGTASAGGGAGVTHAPPPGARTLPIIDPIARPITVTVHAEGAIFADAQGANHLADMVQSALARQESGQMPSRYNGYGAVQRIGV